MEQKDPYAPFSEVGAKKSALAGELPFFPVSVFKLTLMSVFTFGLYQAYWFYKNWQRVRERGEQVSPFWRTCFGIFFCYALFVRVRDYEQPGLAASKLMAGPLATGWIVANLVWQLPEPYLWLGVFTVAFMLPVQARANEINSVFAPRHDRNDHLTGLNWVAIVLFGLLYVLAIVGSMYRPVGLDGINV